MKIYLDDLMVVLVLVFTIGIICHGAAYPDGYDECDQLAEEMHSERFILMENKSRKYLILFKISF